MGAWALKFRGGGTNDWFLDRLTTAKLLRPDAGFDTIIGDDFGNTIDSELTDVVGTADATPSTNDNAGVVTVAVGDPVVATSSGRLAPTGAGSHVKALSTGEWYMAALVKITQPLDVLQLADTRADAVCLFGDADNFVSLGIFGIGSGGSTTNWVGAASLAASVSTTLGPPLDPEEAPVWHLFEAWNEPGVGVHLSIDSVEFPGTIASANVPGVSAMLSAVVQRTAVGDQALVNVDKYCAIVPSPTVGAA
jgi:hypothetical protein